MPPTYATVEQLREYVTGTIPEDDTYLEKLLMECEVELDDQVPRLYPNDEVGPKIIIEDETNLLVDGLMKATCAQAEYHLHMGEAFFIEAHGASEGPDTMSKRKAPRIAPKAMRELRRVGLVSTTGTMTQTGGVQTGAGFTLGYPRRTA